MARLATWSSTVTLLLQLLLQGSQSQEDSVDLKPDDPNVIVGEPLMMTCSLKSTNRFTSKDLMFGFKKMRDRMLTKDASRISHEYILQLNKSVAQLNWTDITEDYDRAEISCFVVGENDWNWNKKQIIKVGYPPSKPVILKHHVYNWERFIFKWTVERADPVYNSKYTAWYKVSGDSQFRSCRQCFGEPKDCPHQTDEENSLSSFCEVKVTDPFDSMLIKVTGENELYMQTESDILPIDLNDHIKPACVEKLTVTGSGGEAPIAWFIAPVPNKMLLYNVQVYCGTRTLERDSAIRPDFNHRFNSYSLRNNCTLANLTSYADCEVLVRCKPYYYEKLRNRGYWSELSTVNFTSQEGVPVAAPMTCRSCFESKEANGSFRHVTVHYKPLMLRDSRGIVTQYRSFKKSAMDCRHNRTANCAKDVTTMGADSLHIHWLLPLDKDFELAVEAATAAGYNDSLALSFVEVPAQNKILQELSNMTALLVEDGLVNMTWKGHPDAVRYVVVWCIGSRNIMQCTGELNWLEIAPPVTVHQISVLHDPTDYLFGMALETETLSSGIHWILCTYNARYPAGSPLFNVKSLGQTTITLSIEQPGCEHNIGYVYAFVICYRDAIDPIGCAANSKVVSRSELKDNSYTVEGLKPGTEYFVSVQSLSLAGPSHSNLNGTKVKTEPADLTTVIIVSITVSAFILLVLIVLGIVSCIRNIHRICSRCRIYWYGLPVKPPQHVSNDCHKGCDTQDSCVVVGYEYNLWNQQLLEDNHESREEAKGSWQHLTEVLEQLLSPDCSKSSAVETIPPQESQVGQLCAPVVRQPHPPDCRFQTDGYSVCLQHDKPPFRNIPTSEPAKIDCQIPHPEAFITQSASDRTNVSSLSSDTCVSIGCLWSRARPCNEADSDDTPDTLQDGEGDDIGENDSVPSYLRVSKFCTSSGEVAEEEMSTTNSSELVPVDDSIHCGPCAPLYDELIQIVTDLANQDEDLGTNGSSILSENLSLDPSLELKPEAFNFSCPSNIPDCAVSNSVTDLANQDEDLGTNGSSILFENLFLDLPLELKPEAFNSSCPSNIPDSAVSNSVDRVLPSVDCDSSDSGSRWMTLLNTVNDKPPCKVHQTPVSSADYCRVNCYPV